MKRIVCLTLVLLLLTACSNSVPKAEEYKFEEYYHDDSLQYTESDLEQHLEDQAFEYITSAYSFEEILDLYEEQFPETFQDTLLEYLGYRFEDMPNMTLIMEELAEQGLQEEYAVLFQIAEKIGYYPSAIVGAHCLDTSAKVIHLTNSSCLSNIDFSDMYFICQTSENDLVMEMDDNDSYLQDCTLCEKCWFSEASGYIPK